MERLADLEYVTLMRLYVTVKGGAPLLEINRPYGIAIDVVESWSVGAKLLVVAMHDSRFFGGLRGGGHGVPNRELFV